MTVSRIVPNINAAIPSASRPFYEGVLGLDIAMDMGWIVTFASPSNPTAQLSVVASDTRDEPHADVSVFISIKLARQKEEDLDRFAKAISKWDEVLECYLMTGNRDYLLRVVAADLSAYETFLKTKLTRLDGIASIESSFALSQVKYSIALPV